MTTTAISPAPQTTVGATVETTVDTTAPATARTTAPAHPVRASRLVSAVAVVALSALSATLTGVSVHVLQGADVPQASEVGSQ